MPHGRSRFYVGFAIACALIAFLSFAPTYWLPLTRSSLVLPSAIHLHAAVQFSWVLLFVAQAALAGSGRMAWHRRLGVAGVALAAGMVVFGVIAALHSVAAAGYSAQARSFLITPVTNVLFFGAAVALAAASFRRPDVHKRLMVLATVAVLVPAISRIFLVTFTGNTAVTAPPVEVTLVTSLTTDLLLVVAMVLDRRRHGRIHAVYWIGGGLLVALQVVRVPLAYTAGWQAIAEALIRIGAPGL